MNIVLVGMPGAGKSTVGPALAAKTGRDYVDTDDLVKEKAGSDLKDIVSNKGYEAFLEIQEDTILAMKPVNTVIATGGSVVCSEAVMGHLKKDGLVVFLKLDFDVIEKRLSPERRLARTSGKSLRDVYAERLPLYEKYAGLTIDCTSRSVEEIVDEIIK